MKALIFDIIHGGDYIAKKLMDRGYDVYCVDVYRYAKQEIKDRIVEMGANLSEEAPAGEYALLLAPSHCPVDMFLRDDVIVDKRITFHQAVGEFIDDKRFRIEVTGVKGKTSLCYMLAHILDKAGKKVFLHTSRGQGQYVNGEHRIDKLMSIAPTSLLVLPEGDYDVMVTEVSLGGSGKADIAVITNLLEDYGIAKNTGKASTSKASILTDNINIVESSECEFWKGFGKDAIGYGGRVRVNGSPRLGEPLDITIDYDGKHDVRFGEGFLGLEYIHAIDAALTICEQMSIPKDVMISALESFRGIPGRGEISKENGIWTVTERNPGISHISIGSTLSTMKRMGALDGLTVILDPVNRRVCDKLDIEQIRDVIDKYDVRLIFLNDGKDVTIPEGTKTILKFIKEGFQ